MYEDEIKVEEENLEDTIPVEEENVIVNTGGTTDYRRLNNKPSINNVELLGNKSLEDLGIDQDFVKDNNYVHTDNNYTTTEKNKLAGLNNYDDTEIKQDISNLQTNKADKTEIPDVSNFITKDVSNLINYTLKTNTGSLIDLEINQTTYVITLSLKDQDGNVISTDTIDLPLENVVVSGSFDSTNKKIVLTLQNGNTVDIPVGDLVAGLQTEITPSNKIASGLIDDANSGNKFTTTSEKQTWNGKYDKPNGGIPKTDLSNDVQTSLSKADTAIQDISGKQDVIDSTHKLSSDLVDDTNHTNKFVTSSDITNWNGKADASHFVTLSQSDYDDLTTKDPDTYYFIEEE